VTQTLEAALEHPLVARLAAALAARPGQLADVADVMPPPRRAAVAAILRVDAARSGAPLEILFIKRAEYEGDPWSGHVAFPGGRHEPGDATLWDTAARETWEEIGLDLRTEGRALGTLDEVFPRSQHLPSLVVRPYVAITAATRPFELSDEVAAAFWVPIARLGSPDVDVTSTVQARGVRLRVPSFVHDGHTIWGMTERILRRLLELAT
jgi:8-oxo-dGTP pyrophosphatase MutT (NUDIX family)